MSDISIIPPLNDYVIHLSSVDLDALKNIIIDKKSNGIGLKDVMSAFGTSLQIIVTGILGYLTYSVSKANSKISFEQAAIQNRVADIQHSNSLRDEENTKRKERIDGFNNSAFVIEKKSKIMEPFFFILYVYVRGIYGI